MRWAMPVLSALCLFIATGCGGALNVNTQAASVQAGPAAPVIPASYFGAISAVNIGARPWPDAPMPVSRDFDSSWWRVEPAKGGWTLSILDNDV